MKKLLLVLLVLLLLGLLAAGAGAMAVYTWATRDLPDFKSITDYRPALATTVYAADGSVMGYFAREMRFLVNITEMPPFVPKTFLAAEDAGFYRHEGVDLLAIARAAVANLRAGHVKQGGSTITQQIIKRLVLSPEKSLERKLKEAILAYRLEKSLTKDEILTIYLNEIFLGGGAYGVEAAARAYFGKHVRDLSLAEAAILAGLPQAPSRYNPFHNLEQAKTRQRYVLDRMVENGWATAAEAQAAWQQPLKIQAMADPTWTKAPYYLEEVRRWCIEQFGETKVYEGGLHIMTACDLGHQAMAEGALRRGLVESTKRRGWRGPLQRLRSLEAGLAALKQEEPASGWKPGSWVKAVVAATGKTGTEVRFGRYRGLLDAKAMAWAKKIDPRKTGELVADKTTGLALAVGDVVWAAVSVVPDKDRHAGTWQLTLEQEPDVEGALVSIDPKNGEVLALVGGYDFGRSQFNRATQAKRQPGSSFKPIVYSMALDAGFTPASVVLDAPIVVNDGSDRLWRPENFEGDFMGATILRTALAKSRNLVTVRITQQIGIRNVVDRAKAMGLTSDFHDHLSTCLGATEVTLLNLCQAYTAFPRGGNSIAPVLVAAVTDAWEHAVYVAQPEVREAMSPQTAYLTTALMQEVVRDGTGAKAKELGRPVAGKTGTSNEERNAWFVAFTPYLLTGVFVGFDDNSPMGKNETGGRAALPIWLDYRKQVDPAYPSQDFPKPPGITFARIDGHNGLLAGSASTVAYLLPFKTGSEPTEVSTGQGLDAGGGSVGEDLFKQVF